MRGGKSVSWGVLPKGASEHTLPTIIEVFFLSGKDAGDPEKEGEGPGWYVGNCLPGCLFDSVQGPFATKKEAMGEGRRLAREIQNGE